MRCRGLDVGGDLDLSEREGCLRLVHLLWVAPLVVFPTPYHLLLWWRLQGDDATWPAWKLCDPRSAAAVHLSLLVAVGWMLARVCLVLTGDLLCTACLAAPA